MTDERPGILIVPKISNIHHFTYYVEEGGKIPYPELRTYPHGGRSI